MLKRLAAKRVGVAMDHVEVDRAVAQRAVEPGDLARRREGERDRVVGDRLCAVVRHVAHDDAARRRRLDVDRVRRTVAELTSLRAARELQFAELGVDSMTTYRRGRADGSIPADRFPTDVFLVIDGWATLKT